MKIYNYKDDEHYRTEQEKANKKKLDNIWVQEKTISLIKNNCSKKIENILCHGTRNAKEQKLFKQAFPDANIIGTEISSTASLFPMTEQWDFRKKNPTWFGKFDLLYSNSFDHTNEPLQTMEVWREQIVKEGWICVEFQYGKSNNKSSSSDPLELNQTEFENLISQSDLQIEQILNTHGPDPIKNTSYLYILKIAAKPKE